MRIKNMLPANNWWAAYSNGTVEPLIGWATVDFGGDDQFVRGLVVVDGEVSDAEEAKDEFVGYLPYQPSMDADGLEGHYVRAANYVLAQVKRFQNKNEEKKDA